MLSTCIEVDLGAKLTNFTLIHSTHIDRDEYIRIQTRREYFESLSILIHGAVRSCPVRYCDLLHFAAAKSNFSNQHM